MPRRPIGILSVALLAIATGAFVIVSNWVSYAHLPSVIKGTADIVGTLQTVLITIMLAIPILKVIAAMGLLGVRGWAWALAIPVLAFDFIYRAQMALRFYTYGNPEIMPRPDLGGTVVKTGSLWPSHIIALISLASLAILMRKPTVEAFVRPGSRAERLA
jgi:hypothetical protein